MGLLGVSRQGRPRRRLSLMATEQPAPLAKRLAWFVVLWLAGVATVGTVAFLLRLWMKLG
ncbi:hypothetical protein BRAO285_860003 [Bradyrhizobium sp. ORS 285]|nr:hypothetical protein BRAO285_860003 [Bradyrhizobium sp. ORS 285]